MSSTRQFWERGGLGRPDRWCDQQCDRCGVSPSCPSRGEPIHAAPVAVGRSRLRQVAVSHASATAVVLDEAVQLRRLEAAVASSIAAGAFAVVARVGRLVGVEGEEAIPHLLVIEHYLSCVDVALLSIEALLPRERLHRQRSARWELGRRLEPVMSQIRPAHRAELVALVAAGNAPSPFPMRSRIHEEGSQGSIYPRVDSHRSTLGGGSVNDNR